MKLVFKNKPILIPGTYKGYKYTEERIRKMKLPDQVPLTKDFESSNVFGYVKNLKFSHSVKGIVGDFVLVKRMPCAGYGPLIEIAKLMKTRPNEPMKFTIRSVSFVNRPISAKFMLRRVKQPRR
jgi:hypothetical protein